MFFPATAPQSNKARRSLVKWTRKRGGSRQLYHARYPQYELLGVVSSDPLLEVVVIIICLNLRKIKDSSLSKGLTSIVQLNSVW